MGTGTLCRGGVPFLEVRFEDREVDDGPYLKEARKKDQVFLSNNKDGKSDLKD